MQNCQTVRPLGRLATELRMLYGKVCGLYCVGVLMDTFIIVYLLLRWSGERLIAESNQESTVGQETCSRKVTGPLRTKWVSCHLGKSLPACSLLSSPRYHLLSGSWLPSCSLFLRHAGPCAVSLSEPGSCFYSRSCSRCRDCIYLSLFYWKSLPPSGLVIAPHRFRIDCFLELLSFYYCCSLGREERKRKAGPGSAID